MKLSFPGHKNFDLSFTKIMGTITLDFDDKREPAEILSEAEEFIKAGAEFIEIGVSHERGQRGNESCVITVLEHLLSHLEVPVAVCSENKAVLINAIKLGVAMVITCNGIKSMQVLSALKESKTVICLHAESKDPIDDDVDLVSYLSEFFYTNIDMLLNRGIPRKRIILDPSIVNASEKGRMHLLGRLESFKSFALPMCIAMPRLIPYADQFLSDNKTLSLTASLFCSRINEVKIIRTQDVSDASMAIGFWQLMTIKTRPYRLSKVFVRRLRTIRDSLRLMRKGLIKK